MRQTLAAGSASLTASRIAEQKAQSEDLKEFAQFEAAEQETLADILKSLQNQSQVSGTVKSASEAEVEQHLDQRGRDELQKIKAAPAGAEFDREYLEAQMNRHRELLRIQESYLNSQPSNRDLVNVAKLARGLIREHLQLLADIDTEIESGATTGAAPGRR
jgi:putative membrane protein